MINKGTKYLIIHKRKYIASAKEDHEITKERALEKRTDYLSSEIDIIIIKVTYRGILFHWTTAKDKNKMKLHHREKDREHVKHSFSYKINQQCVHRINK